MMAAFYLPLGLEEGLETTVQRFGPAHEALELHLPVVEAHDLLRWVGAIRDAREEYLARRPISGILRSLETVAKRFLDRNDPARQAAIETLSRAGRFTEPMLHQALDDAFHPLTRGGITRWVTSELGSVAALDRPAPGPGGVQRRAHGPEWMLQIYAGNVPTLPIFPIYSTLLLKSGLLAKTASAEPFFAPLLARTIAEVDERLGACVAVVWWKGGSNELDRAAFAQAPAVLAFGGEESTANVTRLTRPGTPLVIHGPKVSVAYLERRSLGYAALRGLTHRAALDISLYDQQGCLSPHAYYVERRGEVAPAKFAEALAAALEARLKDLPPAAMTEEDAARIQLYRAQARFEAARVLESRDGTDWTVVLEDRAGFEPGPAHRTVRVHAVDGPEEVGRALRGATRYVEALGLEARGPERARLAGYFAGIGIPRIATVGTMQRPSPLTTHGGVRRLLPFVTWSTVESGGPTPAAARASRAPASKSSERGSRRRGRARSR
jgi:hypothetical protein